MTTNPNPLMNKPGARLVLIVSAIALAFTGLTFFLLRNPLGGKPQSSPSPEQTDSKAAIGSVGALGRLEPEGEVFRVAPPAVGFSSRILRLDVKEGDTVKVNQVIAVTDAEPTLEAAAILAQAQLEEAIAELEQAKTGAKPEDTNAQAAIINQEALKGQQAEQEIINARLELQNAQLASTKAEAEARKAEWELQRFGRLCFGTEVDTQVILQRIEGKSKQSLCGGDSGGAISEQALRNKAEDYITQATLLQQTQGAIKQANVRINQRQKDVQRAIASVGENNFRKDSLSKPRDVDVARATAKAKVAQINFEKAKLDLSNARVLSPTDGKVLKVHAKPGETIGTNGIMEIGRTSQMYAVAEVDENLIGRVQIGQTATIKSDAIGGEATGKVVKIGSKVGKNAINSTDPADKQDARVVEVRIKLDNSVAVANLTNLQVRVSIQP